MDGIGYIFLWNRRAGLGHILEWEGHQPGQPLLFALEFCEPRLRHRLMRSDFIGLPTRTERRDFPLQAIRVTFSYELTAHGPAAGRVVELSPD